MSFAENLKQLRKKNHLSQEELAEILDVSRQAVSKWEQGAGYPETEKLLLLSGKLDISLDCLMGTAYAQRSANTQKQPATGTITITSPLEHVIVTCRKVVSTGKMHGGKTAPQYALFGTSEGTDFWGGQPTTFLGWYATEADITNEITEIHDAIVNGIATYTLKYNVRTRKRLLGLKIETE